jgi:hypothetical protein
MLRTLIGALVGLWFSLVLLAVWGGVVGYLDGVPMRPDLSPGFETAVMSAFDYAFYLYWLAGPVGFVIGGLAGFGSAVTAWVLHRQRCSR